MTEIILFIVTLGFLTGQSLAEARHDFFVIMHQDPQRNRANRWKFWGNWHELAWIVFYSLTALYVLPGATVLFWIPIFWIWRTIFHNGFIARFLNEPFYYLGNTGFDGKMKKIFIGSGAVYLGFLIFVLFILILSYLSLKFDFDVWQFILNIFR
jgi:hypothetical protein